MRREYFWISRWAPPRFPHPPNCRVPSSSVQAPAREPNGNVRSPFFHQPSSNPRRFLLDPRWTSPAWHVGAGASVLAGHLAPVIVLPGSSDKVSTQLDMVSSSTRPFPRDTARAANSGIPFLQLSQYYDVRTAAVTVTPSSGTPNSRGEDTSTAAHNGLQYLESCPLFLESCPLFMLRQGFHNAPSQPTSEEASSSTFPYIKTSPHSSTKAKVTHLTPGMIGLLHLRGSRSLPMTI